MLRLTLAVLHLLALGIGMGAIWARGRALGGPLDLAALRRALVMDSWWGVSAVLWIGTGLWRLFAESEKAVGYYMSNPWFHTKLGLLAIVLLLEVGPMITLIRWRVAARRGALSATLVEGSARRVAMLSRLQLVALLAMVVLAAGIARGYGAPG
jgi:putative membrane protein